MISPDRLLLFSTSWGGSFSDDLSIFRPLSLDFLEHFFVRREDPTGSSFSDISDSDSSGATKNNFKIKFFSKILKNLRWIFSVSRRFVSVDRSKSWKKSHFCCVNSSGEESSSSDNVSRRKRVDIDRLSSFCCYKKRLIS